MASVQEIFSGLPGKFQPDKAAGLNVVYQFDITGEDGGKWSATIQNGRLDIREGEAANPDTTLTVSAQDWIKISSGALNSQMAFMTGKLKVAGDMGMAMKMESLFR